MGSGSPACDHLAERLEARLVGPLHARRRRSTSGCCSAMAASEVAHRRQDALLARVGVLVAPAASAGWSRAPPGARPWGSTASPAAAPPPARAMSAATSSNGSSPVVPIAAAHELRHGRVRDLHLHRACTRRAPGARWAAARRGRRHEGRLADAHLARRPRGTPAARPPPPPLTAAWKAACRSAFSASRPTRSLDAALRLRQALFAREAALEGVHAHRRGHVDGLRGVELEARHVAPAEVAARTRR